MALPAPLRRVAAFGFGIPTPVEFSLGLGCGIECWVGEEGLRYGAPILPARQRREMPVSDIDRMLCDAFEDRVLPFDNSDVREYADIGAARGAAGGPVAAIARSGDMAVATCNVREFEDMDIEVVDSWTAV